MLCKNYHDSQDTVHQKSLGTSELHFKPQAEVPDCMVLYGAREILRAEWKSLEFPLPTETET